MIPPGLLPHTVTVVTPVEATDGYGDTVLTYEGATTRDIAAYVQPAAGVETATGERSTAVREWSAYTNDNQIGPRDRVIYDGVTYEVQGTPRVWDTPDGYHHTELRLTRARG